MDTMLEMLRKKNPGLPLYSVTDPEFKRYGRVLAGETAELAKALDTCAIPAEGNCYQASVPVLEEVALMQDMKRVVFGDMPIEAGFCNGRGYKLNAMEYHKCSEVNFTTTGLVLLLALPEQLDDGNEKGTNEALPSVNTSAEGEEKMLWMRNKWLTCHPDSPQQKNGAFVGICGENLALKI